MRSNAEPVYLQLATVLRARIKQGVYPAGSMLPAEGAMCFEHDHGRMTIRRALAVLREEGLITTRRGERSIVRPRPARQRLILQPNERLVSRMPSRGERIELGLEPGVPVLEVGRPDGTRQLFAADQIEVVAGEP